MKSYIQPIYAIMILFLVSCRFSDPTPTVKPTQAEQPAATPTPVNTHTPLPPAVAPTLVLTKLPLPTSTPAGILPSSTPKPFLPDGLAQISEDNIARLTLITSLPVKQIYQLAFSASGEKLATLSEPWDDRFSDYLEVWDISTGQQLLKVDKWNSPWGLFFTPDETRIFADNRLYDLASGELVSTLQEPPAAFSPDGKTYVLSDYDSSTEMSILQLVDTSSGEKGLKLKIPGMVMIVKFSRDGRLLMGGFQVGNHFTYIVWNASTGEKITELINYDRGLDFSPQGSLAAAYKGGQVYLFSGEKMTYTASYAFVDPEVVPDTMDFSVHGDVLAIEEAYKIHFVVPISGKELLALPDACMVKFSPIGTFLVTWCYQGELKIWGVLP